MLRVYHFQTTVLFT